jgi:TolB protein
VAQPTEEALDPGPAASAAGLTGPDGVIVFAGDGAGGFDIWAVRPDGTGLYQVTFDPRSERAPSVSADGSRLVFTVGPDGRRDLYLANGDGSGRIRLTRHAADDYAPAISPDGHSIAWISERSGEKHLLLMTDTGDGFHEDRAEDLADDPRTDWVQDADDPAWFPDGRRLAFVSDRGQGPDIWSVDTRTKGRPHQWTTDRRRDFQPTVGPGGLMAFVREMALGGDRFLFSVTTEEPNPRAVTKAVEDPHRPDFSPDGDRLVVARYVGASGMGLITMSADGSGRRPVPIEMANATDPDWVASLGTL